MCQNRAFHELRAPPLLRLTLVLLLFAPALGAADKPSLVVVISVDQMRADYLDRFRPWFGDDGFNRFLRRGARFTQARQRHATTFTGPGMPRSGRGSIRATMGSSATSGTTSAAARASTASRTAP